VERHIDWHPEADIDQTKSENNVPGRCQLLIREDHVSIDKEDLSQRSIILILTDHPLLHRLLERLQGHLGDIVLTFLESLLAVGPFDRTLRSLGVFLFYSRGCV
jgi:hypothetical protein